MVLLNWIGLDYPGTRWTSMYILDDIDGHELRLFINSTSLKPKLSSIFDAQFVHISHDCNLLDSDITSLFRQSSLFDEGG